MTRWQMSFFRDRLLQSFLPQIVFDDVKYLLFSLVIKEKNPFTALIRLERDLARNFWQSFCNILLALIDFSGAQVIACLENGVSKWPALEGRFPQVSGIQFAFDPTKPPGSRVNPKLVKIGDEYIDMGEGEKDKARTYRMATKSYLMKVRAFENRHAIWRKVLSNWNIGFLRKLHWHSCACFQLLNDSQSMPHPHAI